MVVKLVYSLIPDDINRCHLSIRIDLDSNERNIDLQK